MGHVRRRKLEGGRTAYLAQYRGPDGHERSKQLAKRSEAERLLSGADVTKAEGSWIDPARGRMPLRDWLVRFHESVVAVVVLAAVAIHVELDGDRSRSGASNWLAAPGSELRQRPRRRQQSDHD